MFRATGWVVSGGKDFAGDKWDKGFTGDKLGKSFKIPQVKNPAVAGFLVVS